MRVGDGGRVGEDVPGGSVGGGEGCGVVVVRGGEGEGCWGCEARRRRVEEGRWVEGGGGGEAEGWTAAGGEVGALALERVEPDAGFA